MFDGDACETEPGVLAFVRTSSCFFFLPSLRDTVRKEKNKKKKDFASYRQLLKWLHRERGGGKEGTLNVLKGGKKKSDKTVPDCLHVCRIF